MVKMLDVNMPDLKDTGIASLKLQRIFLQNMHLLRKPLYFILSSHVTYTIP